MRQLAAMAFAGFLATGSAQANFYTYAEWERLPPSMRHAYIAGAFDTYTVFASSTGLASVKAAALHFYGCLGKSRMQSDQLSENVRTFAATRPHLHAGSVFGAVVEYLAALCGPAPTN